MHATTRLGAVALVLILGNAAAASAQRVSACDDGPPSVGQGNWVLDVTYHPTGARSINNLKQLSLATHSFTRGDGTRITAAHGTAHIQDGTSNTIMIAEKVLQFACADADADGQAGIAAVQISMRNLGSDDEVLLSIIAADGELDSRDEEVILVIGNETVLGHVKVFDTHTPPG
jgi:hypothetical protein